MEDLFTDALFPFLSDDSDLQTLLDYTGKGAVTKFAFYDDQSPQDRPDTYVVFSLSDDEPNYSAAGQCPSSSAQISLDIYGKDKASVRSVRSRLHLMLSGYMSATDGTMGTLWIDHCRINSLSSRPQSPIFGDEFGTYQVSMSLSIRYTITVPS